MPNYPQVQFQAMDPFAGQKQGLNALATAATINEGARRTDLAVNADQREQSRFEQEQALIPSKFLQAKIESMTPFLARISQENYGGWYSKAIEPIDQRSGLGAIPRELLPSPEDVKNMSSEQWEQNRSRWIMTGRQLGEMEVAQFKATLERGLMQQKGEQDSARLTQQGGLQAAQGANEMAMLRERGAQQQAGLQGHRELEDLRQQNALTLLGAKSEQRGAGGLTPPQVAEEKQRIRAQILKLNGFSDLSRLEPDQAEVIEDQVVRASRYFDQGVGADEAIQLAGREVRIDKAVRSFPQASPGTFGGNKKQSLQAAQQLLAAGLPKEKVGQVLASKGWQPADVQDMLGRLGGQSQGQGPASAQPGPAGSPQAPSAGKKFSATATNPQTGQRIGYDEETGRWVPLR